MRDLISKHPVEYILSMMAIIIILVVIGLVTTSASFHRFCKSLRSDYMGGIDRTITLYDYNGKEIKSWKGKFDVESNDSKVYFDGEDGKRVIIYNGIVVNGEN